MAVREKLYTGKDVVANSFSLNYDGQILVVPVQNFEKSYQKPEYQLVRACGGFGCSPDTLGTAVFVKFLYDGEECRYSRGQLLGVLKPELVTELSPEDYPFLNE